MINTQLLEVIAVLEIHWLPKGMWNVLLQCWIHFLIKIQNLSIYSTVQAQTGCI